jgi:ADP-ribosylglycohydrolase
MIGAVAGGIAQMYYGRIPEKIIDPVRQRLPESFLHIVDQFNSTCGASF